MPLPLRITFNGEDRFYIIVSAVPPLKDCIELDLLVDGQPTALLRTEHGWIPKDEDPTELVIVIAKVVSARYLV